MKFVPENKSPEAVITVSTRDNCNGVEVCLNGIPVIRFENNADGSHSVLNCRQYEAFHSNQIAALKKMGVPLLKDSIDTYKLNIR